MTDAVAALLMAGTPLAWFGIQVFNGKDRIDQVTAIPLAICFGIAALALLG